MIFQITAYIRHFYNAKNISKVTNQKLRDLLDDVLDEEKRYYAFLTLGMLRKKMKKDTREIQVLDLGAGSKKLKTSVRSIKHIAALSVKKAKYAEILFRLISKNNIDVSIELGTSLGITTSYLSMANKKGKVITLEGCPETAKIAKDNFTELRLKNVTQVAGDFDVTFPKVIKENPNVGLLFIDGNHTEEATMRYFNIALEFCGDNVILVFDDIHWSKGMDEAWKKIIGHPRVQASVDLYEMGLVFLSKDYSAEHCAIVV